MGKGTTPYLQQEGTKKRDGYQHKLGKQNSRSCERCYWGRAETLLQLPKRVLITCDNQKEVTSEDATGRIVAAKFTILVEFWRLRTYPYIYLIPFY